jgi:copper oxidase (laccase) domain-containing protein
MRILTSPSPTHIRTNSAENYEQTKALFSDHFNDFLKESLQTVVFSPTQIESEHAVQTSAHGNAGARVAWSRKEALPASWRVDAFHSNIIAELDEFDPSQPKKADGIFVRKDAFRAPLAIRTADCLAVAVTLESGAKIQAASCFHAGWRGYCAGIQTAAIAKFHSESSRRPRQSHATSEIFVTIGPAVFGASYPCGKDVLEALTFHHRERLTSSPGWSERHEKAFWHAVGSSGFHASGKIFPDLQELMCIELDALGVSLNNVAVYRENTFESGYWPSHRRSMANGQPSTERLVTHLCPPACPSVTNRDSTT